MGLPSFLLANRQATESTVYETVSPRWATDRITGYNLLHTYARFTPTILCTGNEENVK